MINLKDEIALVKRLIAEERRTGFVTVTGKSLTGKTTLLTAVREVCAEGGCIPAVVNLKYGYDPHGLLDVLAEQIGIERLPNYWALSERIAMGEPSFSLKKTFMVFSRFQASGLGPQQRDAQLRQLAMKFVQDITPLTDAKSIALIVDHYEQATHETQTWMQREFVPRVTKTPRLFTVVAGCEVPIPDDSSGVHNAIELNNISIDDWVDYVAELGLVMSRETISVLCSTLGGTPGLIIAQINAIRTQQEIGQSV